MNDHNFAMCMRCNKEITLCKCHPGPYDELILNPCVGNAHEWIKSVSNSQGECIQKLAGVIWMECKRCGRWGMEKIPR